MYPIRHLYQHNLRTLFKLVWFVVILSSLFLLISPAASQDAHSLEVLNYINQARNQAGIHSLIMNPQLVAAAQRHSSDMAVGDFLDHVGSDGSEFWDRMSAAGYAMTGGAENVLYRWDLNAFGVFDQWRNSPPHNANMMSADYVEAGIAYAQSASGKYYYTLVLGARPGVVPPPIALSPTPTRIPPTPMQPTLVQPTSVPPTPIQPTPIPPTPVPPTLAPTWTAIPDNTTPVDIRLTYSWDGLTLVNLSGRNLDLSQLSFLNLTTTMPATRWQTADLTQSLADFPSPDCLQVWTIDATAQPLIPDDCRYRHGWVMIEREEAFWRNADSFVVMNGTELVALCEVQVGVCEVHLQSADSSSQPTAAPAIPTVAMLPTVAPPTLPPPTPIPPDLRLYYSQDNLALVNVSGRYLDLTGLTFQSSSGAMGIERWNTEYLSQSLNNFSPGDCLQVWGFGSNEVRTKPGECHTRHAWIVVGDAELFWRDTTYFSVSRAGIDLGTCSTNQNVCEISLSGQRTTGTVPVAPAPTQVPVVNAPTGSADVRLLYSQDMVALINISGHDLDLSQLAFESDNGVMLASYWDNGNLSRPLWDYPSPDCLQVWAAGEESHPKPAECRYRHAWSAVSPDRQFWRNVTSFRVRRGAEVLATCTTAAAVCEFNVP